jgi:CO/xanthine dehydrogenase FAD-binding subunit
LLVRMRNKKSQPEAVIDIKSVRELVGGIIPSRDKIEISALTTLAQIENHPEISFCFPALAEAVASIGSVQIRNRATIGGNICNASPAADSLPSLFIYGADLEIIGNDRSSKLIPINEFVTGPGRTILKNGELLRSIHLIRPADDQAAGFERLTRRRGVDLATINICCQVYRSGLVRFAVGASAPVPFIVEDYSGELMNNQVSKEQKVGKIAGLMQVASPIDDVRASREYRQEMLAVLGYRALEKSIMRLDRPFLEKIV